MAGRNITLKQDPSDRNKILDGNGNLVFICVSGFPCDADELVKQWDRFSDLEDTIEQLEDSLDNARSAMNDLRETIR